MLWTRLTAAKQSSAWNISAATLVRSLTVGTQDAAPAGVAFKPDGTKMYFVGYNNDSVYEYSLSTAWNISTAAFVRSFSVAGKETTPYGLFFRVDGTSMYIVGTSSDSVHQYTLSTAWNISTATFTRSLSVSGQEGAPHGVFFRDDGAFMAIVGTSGDAVDQYSLSTPWNIATATYIRQFSVAAKETAPTEVFFKPDGTKMYVIGTVSDSVHEYSLSTAWNISTASFSQSLSIGSDAPNPYGLFFRPDGTNMYLLGITSPGRVREYSM